MIPRAAGPVLVVGVVLLAGCTPEEKVVKYKPFFAGLEGSQSNTPPVLGEKAAPSRRSPSGAALPGAEAFPAAEPESATAPGGLAITKPDGTVRLVSTSGLQLMAHIRRILEVDRAGLEPSQRAEVRRLFAEQLLATRTQEEFRERGQEPEQAIDLMKAAEKDILKMFARMPMGERSPNVFMESIGPSMFRVRLTGKALSDLGRFRGMDMVLEEGQWRLRWFVPNR